MSLSVPELKQYVFGQIAFFNDNRGATGGDDIDKALGRALERCEHCFSHLAMPWFYDEDNQVYFNHLCADTYAAFLYFFGNSLWEISANKPVCDKLLLLNRMLHQIFLSYKCHMPEIFGLCHPIGAIIGNASYNDYLCVYQGVTINTPEAGGGVRLGRYCILYAGASVIGNCHIGDNVVIGAGASLNNMDIPDNSIVYNHRETNRLTIRPYDTSVHLRKHFLM